MRPRTLLRSARRRAGLTQRQLADAAGVPQATVGRIEAGLVDPRSDTLDRLLRATGHELAVEPRLGVGVDRSLIRSMLAMTPEQRVVAAGVAGSNLTAFKAASRRGARS
jgi:predicted transcriptional regulator